MDENLVRFFRNIVIDLSIAITDISFSSELLKEGEENMFYENIKPDIARIIKTLNELYRDTIKMLAVYEDISQSKKELELSLDDYLGSGHNFTDESLIAFFEDTAENLRKAVEQIACHAAWLEYEEIICHTHVPSYSPSYEKNKQDIAKIINTLTGLHYEALKIFMMSRVDFLITDKDDELPF